jgi:uncharacterized protein GlcG (DUF336 family)
MAISLYCLSAVSVQAADSNCIGFCADSSTVLRRADVTRVIAQAIKEAQAQGRKATVAVVDRVGNVLGLYKDNGALDNIKIRSGRFENGRPTFPNGGLEELDLSGVTPPVHTAPLAAIAKAITAAYLSSEGNAFSTRTASQIIQEFFNPRERGQPSGPLFGVQFSQLPCGDLVQRGEAPGLGPRRSPLGLSADAGGLPLYIRGTPVGGVGVVVGEVYGFDANVQERDSDEDLVDEIVALAATTGYEAPTNRQADRITAGGLSLRFADATASDLKSDVRSAQTPAVLPANSVGSLISAGGFYPNPPAIRRGRMFGQAESGIVSAAAAGEQRFSDLDAFVLVDNSGQNRYPPKRGRVSNGQRLTVSDVTTILREGLKIANRERAQIRQPSGSQSRVTLSVVDSRGQILGIVRTRDAPVFGIDVSLQKARTAAFFTWTDAAKRLSQLKSSLRPQLGFYGKTAQAFVQNATRGPLFEDGTAFTARAIGNLARPFFPDGLPDTANGPLSRPYDASGVFKLGSNEWSPFNVGLQLDLVFADVAAFLTGGSPTDCNQSNASAIRAGSLANGIQIFPGSVPIYKNGVFVGAIGISGDGVDQDDMVAFLGVHNAGLVSNGVLGNAPKGLRANRVVVAKGGNKVTLRYVQCPVAPFVDSDEQRACGGK